MKYLSLLVTGVLFLTGCYEEENNEVPEQSSISCLELEEDFIIMDRDAIKIVIDSLCQQYPPLSIEDDPLVHENNTTGLIEELNENCENLTYMLRCYACLESYPPQSIIDVELDSVGIVITRFFRVRVPENDFMYMN
ncbi:MAG: hypothetical protein ACRBG0_01015 [Lewinella sp.]|jgi:hypothetical protein|uniref:hypothetical protein n=1 Tax=Lewinella sp. TaxID=2004506 RepID=UPI003D6AE352